MTKEGFKVPISTESLPHGVELPTPIKPSGEERVEMLKIGMFEVDVEILNTLSAPFWMRKLSLLEPKVKLPVLETAKRSVKLEAVVEEMRKTLLPLKVEPLFADIAKSADGEVVPMPTVPACVTMKSVRVDEPMKKLGVEVPVAELGLMESSPHGVEEPMPTITLPRKFDAPFTISDGDEVLADEVALCPTLKSVRTMTASAKV